MSKQPTSIPSDFPAFGIIAGEVALAAGGAEVRAPEWIKVTPRGAAPKRDAGGTMIDILDRLAKHAEPAKVATKMMGQEWWDELARFSQSVPEFRKQLDFLKNPANFNNSLGGNLSVQLATTANHLERLKALTGDIGDRMGRWALPGINNAIEKAIAITDSLERRQKLRDAEKTDEEKGDPMGRLVTKSIELGKPLVKKGVDLLYGEEPTQDPARQILEQAVKDAADAKAAADKARAAAEVLEKRAQTTKDKSVRDPLLSEARRERDRATQQDALAADKMRGAGPAGARDMTDVEFGEAAARASIETRRRIRQYEEALRGKTANVRIPGTGIVTSRQGAEAELADLRKRMDALTAGPEAVSPAPRPNFDLKGPAPSTDLRIDRAPGTATKFPMSASLSGQAFDPAPIVAGVRQAEEAAKGLQTALKQDLSAPASESMQTFTSALQAGVAAALATVVAAAAKMKSELSFTATPTIAPRLVPPSATPSGSQGASAPASPARATGGASSAPRLQSASLRPRGGINVNGPIHVHGVQDVAGLHRGISREADRRARDSRDNGLHDLGAVA